jgi:hypothetical protein
MYTISFLGLLIFADFLLDLTSAVAVMCCEALPKEELRVLPKEARA